MRPGTDPARTTQPTSTAITHQRNLTTTRCTLYATATL